MMEQQINTNQRANTSCASSQISQTIMAYYSLFISSTSQFRNLLNSAQGRHQFCQILQYTSNFYITCMRESAEYGEMARDRKVPSVNNAKQLEQSISNGRKIFRLFLFLNSLDDLYDLIKHSKSTVTLRVLQIITSCCHFIYYITDNIVYLAKLDFVDPYVVGSSVKWKVVRNMFSLIKTTLQLLVAVYTIWEKKKEEVSLHEKLQKFSDEVLKWNSEANLYIRNLIILRRSILFHHIEAIIYLTRAITLFYDLRVFQQRFLNPIFVSGCGIVQVVSNMFRSMKAKKSFFKLTQNDIVVREQQTPAIPKTKNTSKDQQIISAVKGQRQESEIIYNGRTQKSTESRQFSFGQGERNRPRPEELQSSSGGTSSLPKDDGNDDLPTPAKILEDIYDEGILVDPLHKLDSLKQHHTELSRIFYFVR